MSENLIRPIVYEAPNKTPEEKLYIILYKFSITDDTGFELVDHVYSNCHGRTNAFIDISDNMRLYDIDIDNSKILVETKQKNSTGDYIYFITHPDDSLSIRQFIKFCTKEISDIVQQEWGDHLECIYDDEEINNNETVAKEDEPFYRQYMNSEEFYTNSSFVGSNEGQDV